MHKFFVSGACWALIFGGVISGKVRYRLNDRNLAALRQRLHAVFWILDLTNSGFNPHRFGDIKNARQELQECSRNVSA